MFLSLVGEIDLNEKVVIVNDDDGSTERHVIGQTIFIERLANDKKRY